MSWGLEPVIELLLTIDTLIQAHFFTALAIYIGSFIVLASLAVPDRIAVLSYRGLPVRYSDRRGSGPAQLHDGGNAFISDGASLWRSWLAPAPRTGRIAPLLAILERDATWYLVLLRVVPIAPFFIINAAAALTRISARHFHVATTAGLIPTTLIYASLGGGIGSVLQAAT